MAMTEKLPVVLTGGLAPARVHHGQSFWLLEQQAGRWRCAPHRPGRQAPQ